MKKILDTKHCNDHRLIEGCYCFIQNNTHLVQAFPEEDNTNLKWYSHSSDYLLLVSNVNSQPARALVRIDVSNSTQ